MTQLRWASGSCSDVGNVRARNEDCILERPEVGVWAVADGMGGHDHGDWASNLIISMLPLSPPPIALNERVKQITDAATSANTRLLEFAKDGQLCGTTLTVITAVNELLACVWIGDSRAYLWRDATLEQLTRDHTEFQALADAAEVADISTIPTHSRHVLTRAIGSEQNLEIDMTKVALVDGDVIVLCSDGLYDELDDVEIGRVITATESPRQAAKQLVSRALDGDCYDNVSAVVVQFEAWD